MTRSALIACATMIVLGVGGTASGQSEVAKLLPSDGAADDYFGYSVSISGNTAILAAYGDDDSGPQSGSAYVFVRDGSEWTQQAKLLPSDGAALDHFGTSVSLSGDTTVVGAWLDDDSGTNSGSAYVFVRDGTDWSQQAKLLPSDGAATGLFGWSVSISGNTALVGTFADDDNGSVSGSAYVFVRNGSEWTQQAKLLPLDGAADGSFGQTVSLSGDTAVVGAWHDDDNGDGSGSAYVFVRDGTEWTQQAKLLASDGTPYDFFGISVSVSGDSVVVGAVWDDGTSGSAYVFVRNGSAWAQQAKLLASDGAAGDQFGISVSLSGNTVVVGAFTDTDNGDESGSAYGFVRNGSEWTQQAKLLPSDGAALDHFGTSVSLSGDTTVVGAWLDDDSGTNSGSAYVFDLQTCPADIDGSTNVDSDDLLTVLAAWGPCEDCPADIDLDGEVDFQDLLALLFAWGPCP